jgi:hypothetical protein
MVSKNPKNFEFKLGKQGLLLFVAGMSFLLLTVFIIGVRKRLPKAYRQ